MTAAFRAQLNSTHKFVLVALCDNANDQGECYPSMSMLCQKTSLSERTVQGSIAYLEANLYLKRDMRNGRSTYYFIADPRTWCTPAGYAPPQDMHPSPAAPAPPPPQILRDTPAAPAPITINESSIEPSLKQKKRGQATQSGYSAIADLLEAGVDRQVATDWLAVRKAKKAQDTKTGIDGVLAQIAKSDMSPDAAIRLCCERGWAGFNPSWLAPQHQPQPRASPNYLTANEKAKSFADRLTGNNKNEQPRTLIDIN